MSSLNFSSDRVLVLKLSITAEKAFSGLVCKPGVGVTGGHPQDNSGGEQATPSNSDHDWICLKKTE